MLYIYIVNAESQAIRQFELQAIMKQVHRMIPE